MSPAKSGMETDKRDFSSSSISNPGPKSSQEIYWPPTPPPTKLSGAAQRLKEIQDALANCSTPATNFKGQNKRPNPTGPADGPAGKRLRQLPPGWENDALSTPTFGSDCSPSRPTPSPQGAVQHLRDIQKLGMGADKRDFTSSSISNPPKSTQEIYWPPTPPPTKLSSAAQRLKEIEAALAKCSTPVTDSKGQNKRPSPTVSADGPAGKRLRQLPPGWPKTPTFGSDSSPSKPPSLSNSSSFPSTTGTSSTSSRASTQLVFLSQKQGSDRPRG